MIVETEDGSSVMIVNQGDLAPYFTEIVDREPTIVQVPVDNGPTYLFDINSVLNSKYFYPLVYIIGGIILVTWILVIVLISKISSQGRNLKKFLKMMSVEKNEEK